MAGESAKLVFVSAPVNPLFSTTADLYSEEDVKAKIVAPALLEAGYREGVIDGRAIRLRYNHPLTAHQGRNTRTIFADLVVEVDGRPVIVIDAKNPRQYLTENDRAQVISYARLAESVAPYAVLCNGQVWQVFDTVTKQEITRLPTFDELLAAHYRPQLTKTQREYLHTQASRALFAIDSARELSRLMRQCHDIIRNLKGYDPTKAFDELSKVLFAKMYEEREVSEGRQLESRFNLGVVQKMRHNGVEIIQTIWQATINSPRYREVFSDHQSETGEIKLPPEAIDKIVSLLEDKSLGQTNLDVKGVAFEEFLASTYRGGGLGQYFTPREVVNFMVDLASPAIGDRVIDPSCGTGGFLIRSYDILSEKISSSELSEREKETRLRDLANASLVGVDWEARAARTCKMNMIIHGDGHAGVYQGNALDIADINVKVAKRQTLYPDAPAVLEGTFDIVLTNPPFGARDDTPQVLNSYELGRGRNTQKREVLLLERCIRLLRPGGRMVAVIPEGILSNQKDKRVRNYILRECIVKAVIRLPQDAFKMSEGAACTSVLYVVKKDPSAPHLSKQGDMFFARAAHIGVSPSGKPIDRSDLPSIREQYRKFERGEWDGMEMIPDSEDRMRFLRDPAHALDDGWREPEANRTSLLYDQLCYVIREPNIIDRFSYTYNHPLYYRAMATLDGMRVDKPTLKTLCVPPYPVDGAKPSEQVVSDGLAYIKAGNVTVNGITGDTEYFPDTEEFHKRHATDIVKKGDLLVTSSGEGTIGRVAIYPFDDQAIADGHVTICRLKPNINKWYVEQFLKSEYGQVQMLRHVSGSTGQTELVSGAIADLRIPVPALDVQEAVVADLRLVQDQTRKLAESAGVLRQKGALLLAESRQRMIKRIAGGSDPDLDGGTICKAHEIAGQMPRGVEVEFMAHAEKWRKETRHTSSLTKMIAHQSYRRIMGMGREILPVLFKELRERPDHWLVALNAITGEDPAPKGSTFEEAVESWLVWGRERGYLG